MSGATEGTIGQSVSAGDVADLIALAQEMARSARHFAQSAAERWPSLVEDAEKMATSAATLHALATTAAQRPGGDSRALRHALRTPLNHVFGYSELLLEDLPVLVPRASERNAVQAALKQLRAQALTLVAAVDAMDWDATRMTRVEADPLPAAQGGRSRILVVDDVQTNRDVLMRRLERLGHSVTGMASGSAALEVLRREPFDLVLLDIMMPGLDGREVLRRMKEDGDLRHIPIIVVSALSEMDSIVRCIEAGAEDYLQKPIVPTILNARVEACLEKKRLHDQERRYRQQIETDNQRLEQRVQQQVREIATAQLATIFALSKLAESRDPETGAHLERIREYSRLLAQQLRRFGTYDDVIDDDYVENLYVASVLHDIGKVAVPDRILQKPGKLTEEEFGIMKTHAVAGAETLRAVDKEHPGNPIIRLGIEVAESHHERWDGQGYPYGKAAQGIPLAARIVALADVYDALRSRRTYKPPFDHPSSRQIIGEGSGRQFDPHVVYAFLEAEEEFQYIWKHACD